MRRRLVMGWSCAYAPRYDISCKRAVRDGDAARRTQQRGQGIPVGSNRSAFQHMRFGNAHLADKLAYLRWYSWSAATVPRVPAPVRSEPGTLPFYDGSPASQLPRRLGPLGRID